MKNKTTITIARIEITRNEHDDSIAYITDPWEIWDYLEDLKKDHRSKIEIEYEDVDAGFIIRVFTEPISKEMEHATMKKEVRREFFSSSNKIGRRYEDEEGNVWLG